MAAYMIGVLTEAWVGKFGSVPRLPRGAIGQGVWRQVCCIAQIGCRLVSTLRRGGGTGRRRGLKNSGRGETGRRGRLKISFPFKGVQVRSLSPAPTSRALGSKLVTGLPSMCYTPLAHAPHSPPLEPACQAPGARGADQRAGGAGGVEKGRRRSGVPPAKARLTARTRLRQFVDSTEPAGAPPAHRERRGRVCRPHHHR
jgi:hypothetical protein